MDSVIFPSDALLYFLLLLLWNQLYGRLVGRFLSRAPLPRGENHNQPPFFIKFLTFSPPNTHTHTYTLTQINFSFLHFFKSFFKCEEKQVNFFVVFCFWLNMNDKFFILNFARKRLPKFIILFFYCIKEWFCWKSNEVNGSSWRLHLKSVTNSNEMEILNFHLKLKKRKEGFLLCPVSGWVCVFVHRNTHSHTPA